MKKHHYFKLVAALVVLCSFAVLQQDRHTLYVIGDSTVRNSNTNGLWGWGTFIGYYFDTSRLATSNQAMAGRSTRTFIKEGRWEKVINAIKPGDFLMMQFGHNEGSKPDTGKNGYRGVLNGTSEDSVVLNWGDGKFETVHSYGWYLTKFVSEAKAKGATVYICSMIPRNDWKNGKVVRANTSYGKWAQEVAAKTGAGFIDLNSITADKYDKLGADSVAHFFPKEHTHTNKQGAEINAASVAEGLKQLKNASLTNYLLVK